MPPYRTNGSGTRFNPYPNGRSPVQDESSVTIIDERQQENADVDTTSLFVDGVLDSAIPASERNRHIPRQWIRRDKISRHNIHTGDVVKIHSTGDYLQIKRIHQDPDNRHKFMLQGVRYRSMSKLPGGFDSFKNEVMLMQEVYLDSDKSASCDIYLESYTIDQLLPVVKRKLSFTNFTREMIKHDRREQDLPIGIRDPISHDSDVLWCRSKHVIRFSGRSTAKHVTSKEKSWARLKDKDIPDERYRIDDLLLRLQGRYERRSRRDISAGPSSHRHGTYCLVDICCGAGFTSEGGRLAGFKVTWGCDNDVYATRSFAVNHRDALAKCSDFQDFIHQYGDSIDVDCLVISFPCQPWSPALVKPGRNDETNRAALLGLEFILQKLKPRLVVLEETFGLTWRAHKDWLATMLAMFCNTDYSLRMATLDFRHFDCNSDRKRLIILAAAPGEALPDFPTPSANASSTRRSLWDVLCNPIRNHPNHAPFVSGRNPARNPARIQFDPRRTYAKTLMKGSMMKHWLGGTMTPHEGMRLIGARDSYILKGPSKSVQWGQVGNAFPPVVAEKILRKCRESLEDTDREDDRRDRNLRERGTVIDLINDMSLNDRRPRVNLTARPNPGVPFAGIID
ncbi:hypothetical protein KVT40_000983 [Elsinoe batatas]|uniref:DNA (cytosine-5-)-methyltransferase n=1 Tax=Elsinoe batatas TaxID=2601811 RepID=A0A8K0PLM1_9PEZI|nr:hypothetical protein KVT40_000983 [Elsinoe batatas]